MRPVLWGTAAAALSVALAMGCGSTDVGPVEMTDAAAEAEPVPDADVPDTAEAGGPDVADAGKDVVVPTTGYCAGLVPKPKFCDDFDDLDLTNDWDQPTVLAPSVMDLDDSTYTSAPVSYIVTTKALLQGSAGNVHLRKTVLGAVSHVQLAFSAFFATTTLTQGLVAIATLDVSSNHLFTLYLRDDDPGAPAAVLEEQVNGTVVRHVLAKLPVAKAWTRIILDLDFVAGKANLSFGAQKALDDEPITALVGTEATIRLGAVYVYGKADPFQAGYDDVFLDF
jgi:hypothetical protein